MTKKVERVEFRTLPPPKVKRVAAYARVSSAKDAMLHSLAAQVCSSRNSCDPQSSEISLSAFSTDVCILH